MAAPSYASEPQVQYLHQILEQIERCELLVPDFQRPPRWTDDQRRKLLESVSQGYPIGAVMAWRTTVDIPHRREIGPQTLSSEPAAGTRQYLLDGFQRMSTLYAALRAGEPSTTEPDENGNRWALGYHLIEQEWVFLNEVDDGERNVVVAGHLLLDSVALLRFQRSLEHPKLDLLLRRSDALVRSVREYKLPIIPMVTDDVDEAIRTFGLLNTEGTRMSDLDLVVAITWKEDYNLRGQLDEAKEALGRIGWEDLDEKYILAVLREAFDLDVYDRDAKTLGERLKSQPHLLAEGISGLVCAGEFLADRCGVVSLDLLPYSYQAVILADVLRRFPTRPPGVDDALVQWFWWTTAWTTFAGISGYRMKGMLSYLRGLARGAAQPWPWRIQNTRPAALPATADPRGALVRAVTLQLYEKQERDNAVQRRLEAQAARALTRGIPDLPAVDARDLGNAFLVETAQEETFLAALDARRRGADATAHPLHTNATVRSQHLIDDAAWNLLGRGDGSGFVRERRSTIEAHHQQFLDDLGLPPGVT